MSVTTGSEYSRLIPRVPVLVVVLALIASCVLVLTGGCASGSEEPATGTDIEAEPQVQETAPETAEPAEQPEEEQKTAVITGLVMTLYGPEQPGATIEFEDGSTAGAKIDIPSLDGIRAHETRVLVESRDGEWVIIGVE